MPAKGGGCVDADVVVAGGGVIGTAIAWRAAAAGRAVIRLDPGDARGKARVAAGGSLAPESAAAIDGGTVTLATGEVITATSVVAAAGWAVSRIDGVPDPVRKAVRPVKGQILRLRHPGNLPPVATRTIRALVAGRDVYLVPRA